VSRSLTGSPRRMEVWLAHQNLFAVFQPVDG
jgi:hypothetical protein